MADNQKMWAELGMNLEMHDMLCEVLPGAIGDVFMSQENRPAAMDYFDMVLADVHGLRPAELVEFRKNGGKVFGTFCDYVPDEVIFAAGGIATGLCAGSQFWVPGGERYLPANTCPLIKAMLGARFDKTCPFYRLADVYIGETTCDGKKKAYEILGTDVPLHVMDLPQMKREKDYHKWADEIKDLIKVVEETTGNKVTAEALAENIKKINAKRAALQRLYSLRWKENVPISGTDVLLISQIAYYDD
ncbi:MAG: 2-hydroxyacyl-CoA dehydratase, partial [Mogibacterium sp.]|nr:2-hydroxyacyl-CoA dehydratase [Mogibacterium sp.]